MDVPVITVPNPFMEKILSTGRRNGPCASVNSEEATSVSSVFMTSSMPSPVVEETVKIGASARKESSKNVLISSMTSSSHSASTMSFLVMTINPRCKPSSRQISKCSLDCGIIPSSAAMIKATRSMPEAPATMFFTKRSWPGTSMMPRRWPQGRSR